MSNFKAWWAFCQLPEHDGHADDSADDGAGLTRWGWTYPTWVEARSYIGGTSSFGLFRAMDGDQAGALAQIYHWNRHGGRDLATGLDVSMVDFSWTSGGAVREVQSLVGATVDGIWGPQTAGLVSARGAGFVDDCAKVRKAYYTGLGFRERFPGLFRRTDRCRLLAQNLIAAKKT